MPPAAIATTYSPHTTYVGQERRKITIAVQPIIIGQPANAPGSQVREEALSIVRAFQLDAKTSGILQRQRCDKSTPFLLYRQEHPFVQQMPRWKADCRCCSLLRASGSQSVSLGGSGIDGDRGSGPGFGDDVRPA
jgi:hypothetical protein